MKSILVGYTGFVGSNLARQFDFDLKVNSKNVETSFGTNPDLLVYAGIPAKKFIANKFPEKDKEIILNAIENIKKIQPKKLILISTIDVYNSPINVTESSEIDDSKLQPYGLNRFYLENWVRHNIKEYLIVRLPALFGKNIKKNFIYDLMNPIPTMINSELFKKLSIKIKNLNDYYALDENGFYICKELALDETNKLKDLFKEVNFSSAYFTDSRSQFQFYNLDHLWAHINIALNKNIKEINLATEPLIASELHTYLFGNNFKNEISSIPSRYDFKTKYYKYFNGENGYISSKQKNLEEIKNFIKEEECSN